MADLVVDYSCLQSMRDELARIHRQFVATTAYVAQDEGIFGSRRVQAAVEDFINDWAKHREKLQANIEALHGTLVLCLDEFAKVDRELAEALQVNVQ